MSSRPFSWLLAVLCFSCAGQRPTSSVPDAIVLDPTGPPLWLGTRAALAVDVDESVTIEDVLSGKVAFGRSDFERPSFRLGAGVIWLRLNVRATASALSEPWALSFSHPRPREVVLFWRDATGQPRSSQAGLSLPSAKHEVRSRSVVLPLPLDRPGEHEFYVRLEAFPVGFSGVVIPTARLRETESLESAALGAYYGVALGLLAYNLVLFVLLRRREYLLFGALAVCHALFFLGRNGWLWRLGLWSATPRHVGGIVSSVTVIVLLWFTMDVLGTREGTPRLHRIARWVLAGAGVNAVLAAFGLGRVSDPIGIQLGLAAVVLVCVMAVRQWLARQPGAGAYLLGFGAYLVGAILYVAKLPGWIPHTALTEHAMQVGSALNLVFSALALAAYVKWLDKRRTEARNQTRLLAVEHERAVADLKAEGLATALRAQDEERHRIARDLHDGLGHLLLRVKTAAARLPDSDEVGALVTEGLGSVRTVSQALYPTALDAVGLSLALEALAQQSVRHAGVGLSLDIDDIDPLVDPAAHQGVYRIVQQALANAVTHGRPRHVSVEACREGDEVLVAVTDDGVGFEMGAGEGSGLRNMRQRAALAGGALVIDSTNGEGTRVELRFPVSADRSAVAG